MVFSANPLSLSVPEPAFESWLRDSGYLEILDERTTNLDHHSSYSSNNQSDKKTTTTAAASSTTKSSSSSTITSTSTINYTLFALSFSYLSIIFSLFTLNPFAKLTTDDFSGNTPSWTVGFIGSFDSYSFPSTPSQAKLRVHENIKRYARNYATLLVLFFACSLYQMPVSLLGLVSGLALWDGVRYCSHRWNLEAYPSLKLTLVRFAQCGEFLSRLPPCFKRTISAQRIFYLTYYGLALTWSFTAGISLSGKYSLPSLPSILMAFISGRIHWMIVNRWLQIKQYIATTTSRHSFQEIKFSADKMAKKGVLLDRGEVVFYEEKPVFLGATAVILYCSSVQIATFWAIAVGYAVMLMHASLRKLSPSKQSARADGNKRFLQSKNRG
ncbi:hypothetical protein C5167_039520 [Papaver somniferum]|uniref:PRA1 family protein n=1 Tax=Papaver somniferum TaxID=3469 RepID=A0A4Y7ICI0_PAPSO|nr:hypothetical protein C5167_039520 [Papaver somniferum]